MRKVGSSNMPPSFVEVFFSFLSTTASIFPIMQLQFFIANIKIFDLPTIDYKPQWAPCIISFSPILNNIVIIVLFSAQHSILANPSVKSTLTHYCFRSNKQLYLSFYVICVNVAIEMICICWEPLAGMNIVIWNVPWKIPAYSLIICGAIYWNVLPFVVLFGHRMAIPLFGAGPLLEFLFGPLKKSTELESNGAYGLMRHPLYASLIGGMAFTPQMTLGRLILTAGLTIYMVLAVKFIEEPKLMKEFGDSYKQYMKKVPYRFFPWVF